jgi:hypothetical protein
VRALDTNLFGWRKFRLAWAALVLSSLLNLAGTVESGGYVTLVLGILALYKGANVANQYIKKNGKA